MEDPKNPSVALLWDKVFHQRKRQGLFPHLGTYVIDSITTLTMCVTGEYLKAQKRIGGFLYQQDYNPIMATIENAIREVLTLPCDVLIIAHDEVEKDEPTGRMYTGPQFIGKSLRGRLPLLFDEVYYMVPEFKATGPEYRILTKNTGAVRARTRIGKDGRFATYETPDIKALLKKAGLPTEDKPML